MVHCVLFACLLDFRHLLPFLFTYFSLLSYLPFTLRRGLFCFQAGGRKRRSSLGLSHFGLCVYFEFQYCCVPGAWLFCIVVTLVIRVNLSLLYISAVVLLVLILFSQYYSRDWLGRASLKLPILCRNECKALTGNQ